MSRRFLFTLFVLTFVLFIAFSDVAVGQGRRDQAFERVMQVQARNTTRLMAVQGVVGTGIGLDDDDNPFMAVLIEQAGVRGIPRNINGVPVNVIVTGKFYALAPGGKPGKPDKPPKPEPDPEPEEPVNPRDRFDRPVPIGVSTGIMSGYETVDEWVVDGRYGIFAGTLGCRLKGSNGFYYALSNNHVLANLNDYDLAGEGTTLAVQPGTLDGGLLVENTIGFTAGCVELDFSVPIYVSEIKNNVDAAVAVVSPEDVGTATPADGYGIPSSSPVEPQIRMKVQKYGRTTGLTTGKIAALNVYGGVSYWDDKVAYFKDMIMISPATLSAAGDSGSLIVTQKGNNPVGLLFAGSSSYTLANPIDLVLSELSTELGTTLTVDDGN